MKSDNLNSSSKIAFKDELSLKSIFYTMLFFLAIGYILVCFAPKIPPECFFFLCHKLVLTRPKPYKKLNFWCIYDHA